ncbi:molybdopterin converting factor subunit 1 [Salipaludibacillus agaradhaerens]|uniref:molybdopterin converting factor subunit 1 n=1 Tax=Salipaludibacillus agaradhaerens TaxID=76935 RepID=UPI002151309C|nr:molybdopterin converting factor subunit 1 [Salipaludibacillus agaradhaerens]MCR6107363.1 molybdopterin converting factor subunit 1 [Salipaludibacillus agaradhaerens]MCR6119392.1 molybdopterin converting factor subunit 1 [Salipaludibacillus agaradhaerens]
MIHVLLFADLEEKIGKRTLMINETSITLSALRSKLMAEYPSVTGLSSAVMAINEEYANETAVAKEGDQIAFIPPVSGG